MILFLNKTLNGFEITTDDKADYQFIKVYGQDPTVNRLDEETNEYIDLNIYSDEADEVIQFAAQEMEKTSDAIDNFLQDN